jgi:serine/threonine protein kinase
VKTQRQERRQSGGAADIIRVLGEKETIQDYFELGDQIYDGGHKGQIIVAKRKQRKGDDERCKAAFQECVVKVRTKRGPKENESVWRAVMVRLLASKVSPHVLEIQEVFEDHNAFYIVMAKCSGGELFEFLLKETEVPETECKRIIREILVALCHLHSKGLIHRDVKPENIMFSENGPESPDKSTKTPKTVKLIDFDTCQPWSPKTPKAERFAGTPGYIAPEALIGEASPQSDLWSVGVILHILMTGDMPWTQQLPAIEDTQVLGPSARKMHDVLRKERIDWEQPPWPEFPYAADLCRCRDFAFHNGS